MRLNVLERIWMNLKYVLIINMLPCVNDGRTPACTHNEQYFSTLECVLE